MRKIILLSAIFVLSFSGVLAQTETNKRITYDPAIADALEMIRADSLLSYMQALQDFETRFALAPNRREVATWLMNKFLSFGIPEVRLDSFLCFTSGSGLGSDTITWQYNVEAKITGSTYPDHEVLIMGHYDCIVNPWSGDPYIFAPGADDNASGVAAALECARVIMELEYQPQKTIFFLATAAEELMGLGDSGAKHYAQQAYDDNRKLGLIINNDMIAWNDGLWTVNMDHPDYSPHISWLAMQVLEGYSSLDYIVGDIGMAADLEPFVELGYHGIYFMENFTPEFYPYYHTIFDVVDHLDTAYHAEITKLSLGLILHYDLISIDAALLAIHDVPVANCTGHFAPSVEIANYGSDTITSMDIVYQVNEEDPVLYEWTGSLPFFESQTIVLPEISFGLLAQNELEVVLENVNGGEDQYIGNNSKSIGFNQAMATPNEVKLRIRLDSNPHETTWDIKDAAGEILYNGGPYTTPGVIINETMTFDDGCYIFTIYDAGGDGLLLPGLFLLYYGTNTQILFGTNFGSKAQTHFDVGNTLWVGEQKVASSFYIYPNPVNGQAFLEFDLKSATLVEANVYNLLSQMVLEIANQKFEPGNNRVSFDAEGLNPGMYLISARFGDTLITRKIIKQ